MRMKTKMVGSDCGGDDDGFGGMGSRRHERAASSGGTAGWRWWSSRTCSVRCAPRAEPLLEQAERNYDLPLVRHDFHDPAATPGARKRHIMARYFDAHPAPRISAAGRGVPGVHLCQPDCDLQGEPAGVGGQVCRRAPHGAARLLRPDRGAARQGGGRHRSLAKRSRPYATRRRSTW